MLDHSGIKCMLNGLSSTVVFERPKDEGFVRKWQLACEVHSGTHPLPTSPLPSGFLSRPDAVDFRTA